MRISFFLFYLFGFVFVFALFLGKENVTFLSSESSPPPSHINTHLPRSTGHGGGVAVIFDSSSLISSKPKFENLILSLSEPTWKTIQLVLFLIVNHVGHILKFCRISVFIKSGP